MPAPRQIIESVASAFAIFAIPYMALLQALCVLPRYHALGEPMYLAHLFAGLFLLLNVSVNLYRLVRVDASTRGRLVNSAEVTPAWRFCLACESHSPPRSHHCDSCRKCIIKRDHHCLFAGNCVGLPNQRYYLLTVAYFAIAGTYAALFNLRFVLDAHEGLSFTSAFQMTLPFVALCFGVSSLYQFTLAITQVICLMGGALLWTMLVFHTRLLLVNQTMYERAKRIDDYDLGWRTNVSQVFGHRPLLACVWPFTVSPPSLDGFSFPLTQGRPSSEAPRKTL